MLILTRRISETLVIGEDVFLTVLGVKGNQVRIGICAPKDISVHREEIFVKVKAEQAALIAAAFIEQGYRIEKKTNPVCQLTH